MATFASVWAIKSPVKVDAGTSIEVALKRGGVKVVETGAYLYEQNGMHFYASPPKQKEDA